MRYNLQPKTYFPKQKIKYYILYCIISYLSVSYIVSYRNISYHITSCHIISQILFHVLSYTDIEIKIWCYVNMFCILSCAVS